MYAIIALDRPEGKIALWLNPPDGTPFIDRQSAQTYADDIVSTSPHYELTPVELCHGPLRNPVPA